MTVWSNSQSKQGREAGDMKMGGEGHVAAPEAGTRKLMESGEAIDS